MNKKGVTWRQLLPAIIFVVVLVIVLFIFLQGTSYGKPFEKIIKSLGISTDSKIGEEIIKKDEISAIQKAGFNVIDTLEKIEKIRKLAEEGKCDEAYSKLEKSRAIGKLKDQEVRAWNEIIKCYDKKKNYDGAILATIKLRDLSKVIYDSETVKAVEKRIDIFLGKIYSDILKNKNYDEGISKLMAYLEKLESQKHYLHYLIGHLHYTKGEWKQAISHYDKTLEIYENKKLPVDSKKMYTYYYNALANMKLGNFFVAHKNYKIIENSNYELLKTKAKEKIIKEFNCYYNYLYFAYESIEKAFEKKEYDEFLNAAEEFMGVIDKEPGSVCEEDAKNKLYLLCHTGLIQDGSLIRDRIDELKASGVTVFNFCEDADKEPEKYYPENIPKL